MSVNEYSNEYGRLGRLFAAGLLTKSPEDILQKLIAGLTDKKMQKKILAKEVDKLGDATKYAVELEKVDRLHNSLLDEYRESPPNKSFHKTARQNTWNKSSKQND